MGNEEFGPDLEALKAGLQEVEKSVEHRKILDRVAEANRKFADKAGLNARDRDSLSPYKESGFDFKRGETVQLPAGIRAWYMGKEITLTEPTALEVTAIDYQNVSFFGVVKLDTGPYPCTLHVAKDVLKDSKLESIKTEFEFKSGDMVRLPSGIRAWDQGKEVVLTEPINRLVVSLAGDRVFFSGLHSAWELLEVRKEGLKGHKLEVIKEE